MEFQSKKKKINAAYPFSCVLFVVNAVIQSSCDIVHVFDPFDVVHF